MILYKNKENPSNKKHRFFKISYHFSYMSTIYFIENYITKDIFIARLDYIINIYKTKKKVKFYMKKKTV